MPQSRYRRCGRNTLAVMSLSYRKPANPASARGLACSPPWSLSSSATATPHSCSVCVHRLFRSSSGKLRMETWGSYKQSPQELVRGSLKGGSRDPCERELCLRFRDLKPGSEWVWFGKGQSCAHTHTRRPSKQHEVITNINHPHFLRGLRGSGPRSRQQGSTCTQPGTTRGARPWARLWD